MDHYLYVVLRGDDYKYYSVTTERQTNAKEVLSRSVSCTGSWGFSHAARLGKERQALQCMSRVSMYLHLLELKIVEGWSAAICPVRILEGTGCGNVGGACSRVAF